jgi:serine/threonine protein kinase
MKTLRKSKILG